MKKYIKTLYSISNNVEANYRKFKIKKRSESYRTIYEPSPLLKYIQKQILCNILNNKSISNYAKAYKKGISLKENALPHTNKKKYTSCFIYQGPYSSQFEARECKANI